MLRNLIDLRSTGGSGFTFTVVRTTNQSLMIEYDEYRV